MFLSALFCPNRFLKKCANASLDNLEKAPFWACKPGNARPWCSSYHALFTLDHQAFVPVHSADATDDIIVLVMRPPSVVTVVSLQGVRAVGLAGRLAHDLVDLDGSFVPSAVVSLPQAAHVSAHWRLPPIIFLVKTKQNETILNAGFWHFRYTQRQEADDALSP